MITVRSVMMAFVIVAITAGSVLVSSDANALGNKPTSKLGNVKPSK